MSATTSTQRVFNPSTVRASRLAHGRRLSHFRDYYTSADGHITYKERCCASPRCRRPDCREAYYWRAADALAWINRAAPESLLITVTHLEPDTVDAVWAHILRALRHANIPFQGINVVEPHGKHSSLPGAVHTHSLLFLKARIPHRVLKQLRTQLLTVPGATRWTEVDYSYRRGVGRPAYLLKRYRDTNWRKFLTLNKGRIFRHTTQGLWGELKRTGCATAERERYQALQAATPLVGRAEVKRLTASRRVRTAADVWAEVNLVLLRWRRRLEAASAAYNALVAQFGALPTSKLVRTPEEHVQPPQGTCADVAFHRRE